MFSVHPSRYEQTTALTDLLIGCFAAYAVARLAPFAGFKTQVWAGAFALLVFASLLGAAAHGMVMSQRTNDRLWQPLNLALGLALGLFVVGATLDWRGEDSARMILPFMLILGFGFFLVAIIFSGSFWAFIVYEALAMVFALGVYASLYLNGIPGAGWMASGILVTMLAAAVQATGKAGKRIFWYFDNNGIFHLIQMLGLVCIYRGVGIW